MPYDTSLNLAWLALKKPQSTTFLGQEFQADPQARHITSPDSPNPVKDWLQILILHYLAAESRVQDITNDPWISFKGLPGGEIYFPTFRKRAIAPILKKYGDNPSDLLDKAESLNATPLNQGTAALDIPVFPKIKVAIILHAGDDEFPPECTILFNQSTQSLLPTEDVAVLASTIAYRI